VFLKGCPLRCIWCSNPESHSLDPEIIYFIEKCTGCGRCVDLCTKNALVQTSDNEPINIQFDLCNGCGSCVTPCYPEAIKIVGEKIAAEKVCEILTRDQLFYKHSDGEITLSGGEPLAQPEFSAEILRLCQEKGIHTAIQTSGYTTRKNFERVIPFVDLFIYDIKHMDNSEHKSLTGVSNQIILENLKLLNSRNRRIVIQVALIPGLNDSYENLSAVFKLVKSMSSVEGLSLLSYHTLGVAKYHRIGQAYQLPHLTQASEEYLREKEIFTEGQGVPVIRFN